MFFFNILRRLTLIIINSLAVTINYLTCKLYSTIYILLFTIFIINITTNKLSFLTFLSWLTFIKKLDSELLYIKRNYSNLNTLLFFFFLTVQII